MTKKMKSEEEEEVRQMEEQDMDLAQFIQESVRFEIGRTRFVKLKTIEGITMGITVGNVRAVKKTDSGSEIQMTDGFKFIVPGDFDDVLEMLRS